jgi:hypothetical protein
MVTYRGVQGCLARILPLEQRKQNDESGEFDGTFGVAREIDWALDPEGGTR